jgi:hypothetical protein
MDYKTKSNLILPFTIELTVTNGGRSIETNNHMKMEGSGQFAYDFRNGHKGEGSKLEDYEVFGKEVIAPGDGVISQVINGSIDCMPGTRDRGVGVGNAVIIDHQNGEWSMFCHFKHQSIVVTVGDTVKQGDILGLCGNTGNTSEPHIHFHLQNNALAHIAEPLPIQFRRILVNGEVKENYEPIRGEVVVHSS